MSSSIEQKHCNRKEKKNEVVWCWSAVGVVCRVQRSMAQVAPAETGTEPATEAPV